LLGEERKKSLFSVMCFLPAKLIIYAIRKSEIINTSPKYCGFGGEEQVLVFLQKLFRGGVFTDNK
jgi:hypothetical protein